MTPLAPPLGAGEWVAWRLDTSLHAVSWALGEGAFRAGGRWNSRGVRAIYASLDPATAILEVAVHKGFAALDTVAHVMTTLRLRAPHRLRVVAPDEVANPNWLVPGVPSAGQQAFGDALLARGAPVLIPSAVSRHSWNLILSPDVVGDGVELLTQERFALDTRLHPARA